MGRHLSIVLQKLGVNVSTIGRANSLDATHVQLSERFWYGEKLEQIINSAKPDYIFHLAGATFGSRDELFRINVGLTNALLKAIEATKLKPVLIVAGSAAEYGSAIREGEPVVEAKLCAPVTSYGQSKHAQTCAALDYGETSGNRVIIARIFNPIGPQMPRHLALADFAEQLAIMPCDGGILRVGNIDVSRDIMDVEDTASLLWRLSQNPSAHGVVNICTGKAVPVRRLVEMLISVSKRNALIEIDEGRIRPNELRVVLGSTDLLSALVGPLPQTDLLKVTARIWGSIRQIDNLPGKYPG